MSKRTFPKELDNKFHFHHIVMWTLIVVFMSGVAYIAGLDQLITDQILSFVVVVLIGGFFALVRPPFQIFILGIPCLVFIFSILKFQPDLEVATFNIANGIIFMVTMAIVSSSIYKSTFNQYSRDILLRARNEQLEFLAHHDCLTGLYNRRSFEQEIEQNQLQSISGEVAALVIMDIDHFKKINDAYGHDKADDVLVNIADLLMKLIGEDGIVARWGGGEEFVFLLHGLNQDDIENKVENIRRTIESKPTITNDAEIHATGSFGVTIIEDEKIDTLKKYFILADEALYEAKSKGRNSISIKIRRGGKHHEKNSDNDL